MHLNQQRGFPDQGSLSSLHPAVWWVAGVKLLLHLITNLSGGYGFFRDELYYLACSDHLDLGYVDHPPLSIYILAVIRFLTGESLFSLRLLPAIAGAASVLLTGMIARNMGGKGFAQGIAAAAAAVSPVFLAFHTFFSMNAFELLFWVASVYLVARIIMERRNHLWIVLGVLLGLGLLNKIGMLFFGCGLACALLLTRERAWLRTPWPWACAGIALVIFSPYVVWNFYHDLAHLEFIRNASAGKYAGLSPLIFLSGQILFNNPFNVPLWCAGLVFLFFVRDGRTFRPLGVLFAGAAFVLIVNGTSKPEYLAPAFVILFAAGGVGVERLSHSPGRSWIRHAFAFLLILGVSVIPFGLPVLPVDTYIRYANVLGIHPASPERLDLAELPQFYADMFGWEEQVHAIAAAYAALPIEEQRQCVLYGENYGRAAAIDFFGQKYGLPKAISGHNSYWLWGPGRLEQGTVLLLDNDRGNLDDVFESVQEAGTHYARYALPHENNLTLFVCRGLKIPLSTLWPRVKHYQ